MFHAFSLNYNVKRILMLDMVNWSKNELDVLRSISVINTVPQNSLRFRKVLFEHENPFHNNFS